MSEFTRLLKVDDIAALPLERDIRANGEECRALARRFQLEALDHLAAQLRILPWNQGGARVEGELQAHLLQRCVVSLQPMPQTVARDFVSFFAPQEALDRFAAQTLPVEMEDPEVIEAAGIDLGELVAQQLSLALDPYPHLPDAEMPPFAAGRPAAASPFADLAQACAGLKEKP